jgi:uncharacterized protein YjbI with pentapeptide repeats
MNESENFLSVIEPADRVIANDLPDLTIHGYQVCEKLSERNDRQQITYLARDLKSDRLVVIKEWQTSDSAEPMRDDRHSPSLDYANYLPEIERLQQLDYLNIPRYLNSFPTPTGFCVVREYQSGVSLAELGELPLSDIKLVADGVFKILKNLHRLQPIVIHNNIKPENIIVNTETELTIYLVDLELHPQGSGVNLGNPGFTPPSRRLNADLDATADIYSLGVSLICLLTGTSSSQAQHLFDLNDRPNFRHLLPENTDLLSIAWLEKMVAPDRYQQKIYPTKSHHQTANLSSQNSKVSGAFKLSEPRRKIGWLRWAMMISILFGLGLILRQFLFPESDELSPAQIAKNQEIAKQAEFAASDRGQLIKEKRCVGCNLDRQNFAKAQLSGAIVPQSSLIGANFANANLSLAIFRDADLSGANLSKANLHQTAFYGAKLIGTNLVGANLSNAKLVYAKLQGSWLHDANLSNADLKFAEFQQVDLSNANLTGADLTNADLSYANLSHANLAGAKLDSTNLTGATMPDGSTHP